METESLKKKIRKKKSEPSCAGLSTGNTLLNLALSGTTRTGLLTGKYYLFVGDSASGKSWLAHACLAEAANNRHFDGYRLIYDDVEGGSLMDIERYFGEKLAKRLEVRHSESVEEFFDGLDDDFSGGPFIRVLDSNDSLECRSDQELYKEQKKARRAGKEGPASYGAEKAKQTKHGLRKALRPLEKTSSILIVISQTIDNLGFGFEKKARAGGRALRFFAAGELWFSIKKGIMRSINQKARKIGTILQIQVKKNRQTGREPVIEVPFYPSLGFDDIGGCIRYLIEEKVWSKVGGGIISMNGSMKGLDNGYEEEVVEKIESEGREEDLQRITEGTWKQVEKSCEIKRKSRYL